MTEPWERVQQLNELDPCGLTRRTGVNVFSGGCVGHNMFGVITKQVDVEESHNKTQFP